MTECADHVPDGMWMGKAFTMDCICQANCKIHGCYWRRFHQLSPDKYRRKETEQKELELG
jgi:hypothetical protein